MVIEFIPVGGVDDFMASFDLGDFGGEGVWMEEVVRAETPVLTLDEVAMEDVLEGDVEASDAGGSRGLGIRGESLWLEDVQQKEVDLMSNEQLAMFVRSSKNENTVKKTVQVKNPEGKHAPNDL